MNRRIRNRTYGGVGGRRTSARLLPDSTWVLKNDLKPSLLRPPDEPSEMPVGRMERIEMKRIITNNGIMTGVAGSILLMGIAVSVIQHDFSWLQRFGSLITCIGILILNRPGITGASLLPSIVMDRNLGWISDDPNFYPSGEAIPLAVIENQKSKHAVFRIGPVMSMVGTVVWGFGDQLNFLFCHAPS